MQSTHCLLLLLLCLGVVQAAFEDFVVQSDEHEQELMPSCAAEQDDEGEQLLSLETDGEVIDPQMVMAAVMQQAQRLGLSMQHLAQLVQMQGYDQDSDSMPFGCGASTAAAAVAPQASWYDVFFN
ncbi:uncharacterized protein LOC108594936 [Drosophila busckii]|uniref:uncharacterized protein LOC108594936 n=1 Tax=Drosophila busckii TaxID=30019 RepID=UPI00083EC92D|nr:uncharacterized protein LOC108594936 [Drosophila busckii]